MPDWLIAVIALVVIAALRWDNRHHPHIWTDDDGEDRP